MNEKTSCDVFVQRNDSQQGEKQAPLNTNARIKLKENVQKALYSVWVPSVKSYTEEQYTEEEMKLLGVYLASQGYMVTGMSFILIGVMVLYLSWHTNHAYYCVHFIVGKLYVI